MAEEFNIILEHLKALRAQFSNVEERVGRVERRLGSVEELLGVVVKNSTHAERDYDALRDRVERIERRLDLSDAPH